MTNDSNGKLRLIDLFCCQGGAGMGYSRAGFEVVGVDINPQPNYPFEFHQGDALEFLAEYGHEFDAVHASPPCHDHSTLRSLSGLDGSGHLLEATRYAVGISDLPYVIENVMGAPMFDPVILCGSMFNLGAECRDGKYRQLRRHRQFESNFPIEQPKCSHEGQAVGVYGNGGGGQMTRGYKALTQEARDALGIEWMSRPGLSQSIPPAYTEYVGQVLVEYITMKQAA
jgi:DNA (cytosine-5)-methyltransferase 1